MRHVLKPSTVPYSNSAWPNPFNMNFIFTKSVDPKCPNDAFFHPDIFDYLPFDKYDLNQGGPTVPTLHLSGFATEWMDLHTAVDAYCMDCDDDD